MLVGKLMPSHTLHTMTDTKLAIIATDKILNHLFNTCLCRNNWTDIVRTLVEERNADVNCVNNDGSTLLHQACL